MSTVERDNEAVPEAPVGRPLNQPRPEPQVDTVTPATQAAAAAKSADREYVVLKGSDENKTWTLVSTIEASSAEQAIRRAVELPGTSFLNQEGATDLVAVPARSWNPSSVTVKVETSIVIS